MAFVLASASPRRRELLRMMGIADFEVIPSACEENISGGAPDSVVCGIALDKARDVSRLCGGNDIIIAADTLVYLEDKPLGKPDSPEDAVRMLRLLSGRRHTVYTGVAVIKGETQITGAEATEVFFRELFESEISAYIETGEPLDKAGAYGAQGRGAVFIRRIEGDFFNVMGLPLCRLSLMLKKIDV